MPTRVLVRARAHDAKVIGSNVGGVRFRIRDAATGELLAEGVQTGSTGDTHSLVVDPSRRGDYEGAAGFLAELRFERPTWVEISASGPLGPGAPKASATKRLLLVPGVHVEGDGVVLELYGLTVQIVDIGDSAAEAGRSMPVRARVTMLCGCTIEPGGLWDADEVRVVARLLEGDRPVAEAELQYAGESSLFAGELAVPGTGEYLLEVLGLQPVAGNFGRAERPVVLR